ncbi:MAG: hypothetical protein ACOVNV_05070, partial [Pirellulaceae bacterium]
MDRIRARLLLEECTGDDLWSLEYCRQQCIPEAWIEEMGDCFESGFRSDRETIYYQEHVVGQYEGVRDVDLACRERREAALGRHRHELDL